MTQSFSELLDQVRNGLKVCSDSREVRPGDLFIAVPGVSSNGQAYISHALERGAAVIVSEQHSLGLPSGVREVPVASARKALGSLASAACGTDRASCRVVAVTGTNGKTSVTYLLEHILTRAGYRVGVLGTVGCRWPGGEEALGMTTPDCLSIHRIIAKMIADGVNYVLLEASSHALDQDRLAGLTVDAAVFTNLTQDHLDYHHDFETYFRAKRRLFTPEDGQRPVPVVNVDDPYGLRLARELGTGVGFGLQEPLAPVEGVAGLCPDSMCLSREGIRFTVSWHGEAIAFLSPMVGRHNLSNLLAAAGAALALGISPKDFPDMSGCHGAPGRLERIANSRGLHIFVDYAHTPDALENVGRTLQDLDFNRVFVVFGCGGDRDRTKRPLMARAAAGYGDLIFMTSDNPRTEDPEKIMDDIEPGFPSGTDVVREADRRTAIGLALEAMRPGDALLVAGKGHEAYQIIGTEKFSFHDGQVIRELLEC